MSRKINSVLLAVVMAASMLTMGTTVSAKEIPSDTLTPISTAPIDINKTTPEIVPCYVNIRTPMSRLTVNNTTGTALARVGSAKPSTISTTMRLQIYSNGKWSTIKTWTKSMKNTTTSTLTQKYILVKGCKYRVYSTFKVGSETTSATSAAVTV